MTQVRNGTSRHVRALSYRGSDGNTWSAAKLQVEVNDHEVGREAPGFNGTERVFALLPRYDSQGAVQWDRFDLTYNQRDWRSYRRTDEHVAWVDVDGPAVATEGVAFGMETNVGTLWLQAAGSNTKPSRS